MATSSISISIFFTLLCLGSSTAVFGLEIPTEGNATRLQNDQALDSVDLNCTARIEHLEETGKALIKTNLEQSRVISAQNKTLGKLTGILSLVQNQQESKAGRNGTGILDKELNHIQREFEEFKIWQELKKNASNVQSLRNNIANTTTCGGLITVKNEHEIRYQVPSQENRNESQPQFCIWVIRNSRRHSFLDLKLTDIEGEQDFELWTISGFSRLYESEPQEIRVVGETRETLEPYFALYFRIDPSSTDNNDHKSMSFNLNIKSDTASSHQLQFIDYEKLIILERMNGSLNIKRNTASSDQGKFIDDGIIVKRIDLISNSNLNSTPSFQSFQYPLAPSTTYSPDERTFIILKPTESGSRLRLRMKSVQTRGNSDWVQVVTFSGKPSFGVKITGESASEREFRSGTDEPILVLFTSGSFKRGGGFSFDYAEENGNKRAFPTQNQNPCGGLVAVDLENEISYQVHPNETNSVCIWTVTNKGSGGIQVQLLDQNRWTYPKSTELFIVQSFSGNSSQKIPINIQDPSVTFSSELDSYFLLYFRFNSNLENQNQNNSRPQGFRLVLQDNFEDSYYSGLGVSQTELTPSSTPTEKKEFSYPVKPRKYRHGERAFIIIKPTAVGSKIKIDMTAINNFGRFDQVQIMSYSEQEQNMIYHFLFSGTFKKCCPSTLTGRENEPIIVFFSFDGSDLKSGFRFTYSEVPGNSIP